jgi:flagellar hook-associated protein 3 FlgL
MRISTPLISDNILFRLQASAEQLFRVQEQLSSGRRLLTPADDPPSANRAAMLRSGLAATERYARAAEYAQSALSVLDSTLASIVDALRSVRDTALEAANTSPTPEARDAQAALIENAIDLLLDLGNTQRIAGIYMFAGYRTTEAPFVRTGGSSPVDYLGDTGESEVEIGAGIAVTVNITGDRLYNMAGAADPGLDDLFTTLETLRTEILAGDANAVSARITDIDSHLQRVLGMRAEAGARLRQVEFMADRIADTSLTLSTLLSDTEDVDMAQAIIDLQSRENLYEATAALAAGIQALRLLDYLR